MGSKYKVMREMASFCPSLGRWIFSFVVLLLILLLLLTTKHNVCRRSSSNERAESNCLSIHDASFLAFRNWARGERWWGGEMASGDIAASRMKQKVSNLSVFLCHAVKWVLTSFFCISFSIDSMLILPLICAPPWHLSSAFLSLYHRCPTRSEYIYFM